MIKLNRLYKKINNLLFLINPHKAYKMGKNSTISDSE
jgi:hypothetical protein